MSGEPFAYDGGRRALCAGAGRSGADVLRACSTGDLDFLGFVAGYRRDVLRRAEDSRGAAGPHHAARTGQLSVLR